MMMNKIFVCILLVSALIAAPAFSQQPNTVLASFVINQATGPNPTGAPWPRQVSVPLSQLFPIQVIGSPYVPFVGFTGTYSPGFKTDVFGDILDINVNIQNPPSPATVWGNGLTNTTFWTDSTGNFMVNGTGVNPPHTPGSTLSGQVAIVDSSSPTNWSLTACNRITWGASQSQTQNLTLGDDDYVTVNFLAPYVFPYYGTNRSNCIVNANGFVSWTQGSGDFNPSVSAFLTQMPRIAPLWTDLTPSCGGATITVQQNPNQAVVTFANVQGFGCGAAGGGQFNFVLTMLTNGDFIIFWSANNGMPQFPHISGFTKGTNATGNSLDISADLLSPAAFTTLASQAYFEYWNAPPNPTFDLAGFTLTASPLNANQYVVY